VQEAPKGAFCAWNRSGIRARSTSNTPKRAAWPERIVIVGSATRSRESRGPADDCERDDDEGNPVPIEDPGPNLLEELDHVILRVEPSIRSGRSGPSDSGWDGGKTLARSWSRKGPNRFLKSGRLIARRHSLSDV